MADSETGRTSPGSRSGITVPAAIVSNRDREVQRQGTIGIGIITCNRLDLFRQCMAGIPEADVIVVVNDGEPYPASAFPSRVAKVIQHSTRRGVGASKNDAFRFLLNAGCRHLFLSEDDVRIQNPAICHEYIRAAAASGILHMNFGYHGPRNRSAEGIPSPRKIVKCGEAATLALNLHIVGAFSYYESEALEACGLMDPMYRNALDHVDHTYRIIKRGFHPPFWWFADLAESPRFFEDLDPDLSRSTLSAGRWRLEARFFLNNLYFAARHGTFVQNIPDVGEDAAIGVVRALASRTRAGEPCAT